ncbi:MAG: pilus assembly protein CpaE [Alphaproteobacteria bacterium]|jgi:pilus assembly protein CpaE
MERSEKEYTLPRLNIAIYSMGDHLLEISSQLMLDRRFVNSKVNIFGGGIVSAISVYKNTITPNVLIVELEGDLNQMMSQLFQLSEVCDGETNVIVAGSQNDVELYRELLRHGISEYLVLPTSTTGLISVISGLYKEDKAPLSPSIAFVGAVGGAGTSMISQSIALTLADHFKIDTVFTDLDTSYAMTALSWSLISNKNIDLIVQNTQSYVDDSLLKSCLLKVSDNLNLLTSPIDPAFEWREDNMEIIMSCLTAVRVLSDFNIIDIPAGQLTVEKRAALMTASSVIIVTEPTIKGIRNLGILYTAIQSLRPNDPPPSVILNKVDCPDAVHLDNKIIVDNIGITPDMSVRYVPEIIDLAIARGVPVSSISGSADFNEDIYNLTNFVLGNEISAAPKENIINRILHDLQKVVGI